MRLTINGMHLPTLSLSSALLLALTSLATVPTALAQDRKVFAHWMVCTSNSPQLNRYT